MEADKAVLQQKEDLLTDLFHSLLRISDFERHYFNEATESRLTVSLTGDKLYNTLDDIAEEDVKDGDPAEEAVEGFETALAEGRTDLIGVAEDFIAELEDLRELLVHVLLQLSDLLHSQLVLTKFENLLT